MLAVALLLSLWIGAYLWQRPPQVGWYGWGADHRCMTLHFYRPDVWTDRMAYYGFLLLYWVDSHVLQNQGYHRQQGFFMPSFGPNAF